MTTVCYISQNSESEYISRHHRPNSMDEFSSLVDQLIGRNGSQRNTNLKMVYELEKIFPDGDFSIAKKEDINDLLNDDQICAWIAVHGFSIASLMRHSNWTILHELLQECPPDPKQVLEKRLSPIPDARIFSLGVFRESAGGNINWGDEIEDRYGNDLLAELIVDSNPVVQLEALSQLGFLVGSEPIIKTIEKHIDVNGKDDAIVRLFSWFNAFLDGDFATNDDGYEDDWSIMNPETWTVVSQNFSEIL